MKTVTGVIAANVILVLVFASTANAAIVLSNVDNDLHINVQNPITFDVIADVSTYQITFMLPEAVDVAGSGGFILTYQASTAPLMSGADFVDLTPSGGSIPGGDGDLYITYNFGLSRDLSIGDQVTLSAGKVVLPNFFDFGVIKGLNYTYAMETVLTDQYRQPLSAFTSTVVPVPAASWLLFSALGCLSWMRRRKTR